MPEPTRPYLAADIRRRQLLDAAARLFVRDGYAGLTMVAVAAEAGVSRRLVYNHFPDLAALYEAYFDDRAARYQGAIDEAVAAGGPDPRAAFAGAFEQLVAMPPADQRAVRMLVTEPGLPDLAPLQARFRAFVEARWMPALMANGTDVTRARGLLWMVVSGLFALADLVARDELDLEAARGLANALVDTASRHAVPFAAA